MFSFLFFIIQVSFIIGFILIPLWWGFNRIKTNKFFDYAEFKKGQELTGLKELILDLLFLLNIIIIIFRVLI